MPWLLLALAGLAWASWWGLARYDAEAAPLPPLCRCAARGRCLTGRWRALVAAAGALAEEPTRRSVGAAAALAGDFLAGLAGRQSLRVPYDEPFWAEMAANFARYGCCSGGGVLVGELVPAPGGPATEPSVGLRGGPGAGYTTAPDAGLVGPDSESDACTPGARFTVRWSRWCTTAAAERFDALRRRGGFHRDYGLLVAPGGNLVA